MATKPYYNTAYRGVYINKYKNEYYNCGCSNSNCPHIDNETGYPYPYATEGEKNLKEYHRTIREITKAYISLRDKYNNDFFKHYKSDKFDLDLILFDTIPKIFKDINSFLEKHLDLTILYAREMIGLLVTNVTNFVDLCNIKYKYDNIVDPNFKEFQNKLMDIYNLCNEYQFNPDSLMREFEIYRPVTLAESWKLDKYARLYS